MPKLSFHDRQHVQKMLAHEQTIANIFNEFIASVSPQLKKWTDTGKTNVWIRNVGVESFIDKKLLQLQANLLNVISNFQIDAWKRSNLKNDELVEQYIKGMSISETVKKGLFSQNLDVLKEFQQRKINGMNLSGNVWDLADQTKTQLEFYLESGLSVGRSAATIGQDIRQILKDPDKQFHRIWQKDEDGNKTKLVLSKPMKDYHPGQGKYRSSAMNAKRVAVTETNMMYRKADSERWAGLDFVLGFEVERSGSHREPCKICDAMVGEYPKGFVFTGWHPFCICMATPILMDHEDFADYLLTDHLPVDKYISSVPAGAEKFIQENTKTLNSNPPYWVKDNFKDGDISKGYKFKAALEEKQKIELQKQKLQKAQASGQKQLTQAEKMNLSGPEFEELKEAILTDDTTLINKKSKALMQVIKEKKIALKDPLSPAALMQKYTKDEVDSLFTAFAKHQAKNTGDLSTYLAYLEKEVYWMGQKLQKYKTAPTMLELLNKETSIIKNQILHESTINEAKQLVSQYTGLGTVKFKKSLSKLEKLIADNAPDEKIKGLVDSLGKDIELVQKAKVEKLLEKSNFKPNDLYTTSENKRLKELTGEWIEFIAKHKGDIRNHEVIAAHDRLAEYTIKLGEKYYKDQQAIKHTWNATDEEIKEALSKYLNANKVSGWASSGPVGGVYKGEYSMCEAYAKQLGGNVSAEELSLVSRYCRGSGFINNYLVGKDTNSLNGLLDTYKTAVNGVIEKMPRYNGITYRGVSIASDGDKQITSILEAFQKGEPLVYEPLISTTTSIHTADSFAGSTYNNHIIFKIHGRSGVNVKPISYYSSEDEVIFRSGSKFRILDVHKVADNNDVGRVGGWTVEMEEII